jgi:hypothetical protein
MIDTESSAKSTCKESTGEDSSGEFVKIEKKKEKKEYFSKVDVATKNEIRNLFKANINNKLIIDRVNAISDQSKRKNVIVMVFHLAIKKDKYDLIIILCNLWKRQYKIQELTNCIFDNYKPIFIAAWNGSATSIREIVANGGDVLSKNEKGESLIDAITKGKIFAISQNPENKVFIEDRFERCLEYIESTIKSIEDAELEKASSEKASSEKASSEKTSSEKASSQELFLDKIKDKSVNDIISEILQFYPDNISEAKRIYGAYKEVLSEAILEEISNILRDEEIDLEY